MKRTSRLVLSAMLVALHVVMCYMTIHLGNMNISFAGLPVIIAGLVFGPWVGLAVGLVGSFINQLLTYGLTVTTALWILPAGIDGLIAGFYGRTVRYQVRWCLSLFVCVIGCTLAVTLANTFVMWADAKIFHYYSWGYVFGAFWFRVLSAVLRSVIFIAVLPSLCNAIQRVLPKVSQNSAGTKSIIH